jgi:hypothetical protein
VYRLFPQTENGTVIGMQIRCPETGVEIAPGNLSCFAVVRKMKSPWQGVRILRGSRLLLTETAARFLVEAGTIVRIDEPVLPKI